MAGVEQTMKAERDRLLERIQQTIQQVRRTARRYRRVSTTLLLVGLLMFEYRRLAA